MGEGWNPTFGKRLSKEKPKASKIIKNHQVYQALKKEVDFVRDIEEEAKLSGHHGKGKG